MKQTSWIITNSEADTKMSGNKAKLLVASEEIDSISISSETSKEKEHQENYELIMKWFKGKKIHSGNPISVVEEFEGKQRKEFNVMNSEKFGQSLTLGNSKLLTKRK